MPTFPNSIRKSINSTDPQSFRSWLEFHLIYLNNAKYFENEQESCVDIKRSDFAHMKSGACSVQANELLLSTSDTLNTWQVSKFLRLCTRTWSNICEGHAYTSIRTQGRVLIPGSRTQTKAAYLNQVYAYLVNISSILIPNRLQVRKI